MERRLTEHPAVYDVAHDHAMHNGVEFAVSSNTHLTHVRIFTSTPGAVKLFGMNTGELLTTRQVSERINVAERTLDQWAWRGEGPAFLKVGRFRRYPATDLAAWMAARQRGGEGARPRGGAAA